MLASQVRIESGQEIKLYSFLVADNLISRDGFCWPISELDNQALLLPGTLAICDHAWLAGGAWGCVKRARVQEFEVPSNILDLDREILQRDGYWATVAEVEAPVSNVTLALDLGILGPVSTKFRHRDILDDNGNSVMMMDYSGNPRYLQWSGLVDVYELSLVVVPAQKRSRRLA
jgi:hypothetical protein